MNTKMQSVMVHPGGFTGGEVTVPGDKSISHRVAMLAGLSSGKSRVTNYLQAEDCLNTLRAMEALGARTMLREDGSLEIQGTSGKILQPVGDLNLGNSGTGIRLLAGLVAGFPIEVVMTGDASLCSRPMRRIKEPLERMGATIELTGDKGTAPVRVRGGQLKAIDYNMPMASAQVKSCTMLAALYAEGTTTIVEPLPTRDHTERLLKSSGIPVQVDGQKISIVGYGPKGPRLKARPWLVPGDFSSSAYWLIAAAIHDGVSVTVNGVGLNHRRTALLDVLQRMGADVQITLQSTPADAEAFGSVRVRGCGLKGTEIGGAEIPNLIDEIPIICVAAAMAEGRTVIRDAAELRVKESDRIAVMAAHLQAMGVSVQERPDGMEITGPANLQVTSSLKSHGDHRVAMSMAILALQASAPVCINNIACIETSYPGFWADFAKLGGKVE